MTAVWQRSAQKGFSINRLLFLNGLTVFLKGPYYQPDLLTILIHMKISLLFYIYVSKYYIYVIHNIIYNVSSKYNASNVMHIM